MLNNVASVKGECVKGKLTNVSKCTIQYGNQARITHQLMNSPVDTSPLDLVWRQHAAAKPNLIVKCQQVTA